jgi:predicted ester cyclase
MDRRHLLAGLSLAAMAGVTAERTSAQATAIGRHVVEQFAATLSAHDIDAFAALFADDYVNHQVSAAASQPTNLTPKQASVGFFAGRLTGLPDLRVTLEASLADGDMAAASFVYEGTHSGLYLGVQPTGRHLRFTSCDIFRLANGKIAEHWGMGDIAGIMSQLRS